MVQSMVCLIYNRNILASCAHSAQHLSCRVPPCLVCCACVTLGWARSNKELFFGGFFPLPLCVEGCADFGLRVHKSSVSRTVMKTLVFGFLTRLFPRANYACGTCVPCFVSSKFVAKCPNWGCAMACVTAEADCRQQQWSRDHIMINK